MIRNVLLTAAICCLVSGGLLPERASAMLPVGNDEHRHFYKEQEWIWAAPDVLEAKVDESNRQVSEPTRPTQASRAETAFTMPTHPAQADLAFTMPTHPAQADLAFTMPTHAPQADLAFTMPTHAPQADLAFTM